ncbi:hypothetical protein [Streptomyces mirabilis]|uniref:hypothetical protein n=1 Tax=Streptomyces mirabilis TaxID=68239 RepID=UPI00367A4A8F
MITEVVWEGQWEHAECGASGEALFDDDCSPDSGHDQCDESGTVDWYGQWECHSCGKGGDGQWSDGCTAASHHECDDEADDGQDHDEVEEAAA